MRFRRKPTGRREYPPSRGSLRAMAESRLEAAAQYEHGVTEHGIRVSWRQGVPVERIAEISGLTITEVERAITMDESPTPPDHGEAFAPPSAAPPSAPSAPPTEAESDDDREAREAREDAEKRAGDVSGLADDELAARGNAARQNGDPALGAVYDREAESRKDESDD